MAESRHGIIYEFKRAIGEFEADKLLADEPGREILRRIYQSYAEVAVRHGLPIQLGTPTWRASRKWTKYVAATDVQIWARDQLACAREFDFHHSGWLLRTDERYIDALAKGGSRLKQLDRPWPKNVTILGLPCLQRGLHIVCPKDSHAITCC
jgi:hypothetical protein